MKKVHKCFAVSEIIPIFATAILEKASGNAHFDILHDRLTNIGIFFQRFFLISFVDLEINRIFASYK